MKLGKNSIDWIFPAKERQRKERYTILGYEQAQNSQGKYPVLLLEDERNDKYKISGFGINLKQEVDCDKIIGEIVELTFDGSSRAKAILPNYNRELIEERI